MRFLLVMFSVISLLACDKEKFTGTYPPGVKRVDGTSENNCSLPECSSDRIVRFKAKNVKGTIYESVNPGTFVISYGFTEDSYITFRICNLPEEFGVDGLEVEYSGELLDPCGFYFAIWPEEETYILKITTIKQL